MRFAILGAHPVGLDMARALVETRRHEVAVYSGSPAGLEGLRQRGLTVRSVSDLEEVLADPAVEAVIVAGRPGVRPAQLRRALQSERHILCVYPPDQTPDTAYEAAMIQEDTRKVLLPLLAAALHPGVVRLARLAEEPAGPLGAFRVALMEWRSPGPLFAAVEGAEYRPVFPGWDTIRALRGEVAEVSALAVGEESGPDEPVLLEGRFVRDGLFQAALLPRQPCEVWRIAVVGALGEAELLFPQGWPGPARLRWRGSENSAGEETWEAWDPGPALVEVFETAVANAEAMGREAQRPREPAARLLSWQTAIRCAELDDAARRSIARRRVSTLEFPEATEEVGFKGTMTLVGCAMLWGIILLAILSRWITWLGKAILPLLIAFLLLQLFRWVIPRREASKASAARPRQVNRA